MARQDNAWKEKRTALDLKSASFSLYLCDLMMEMEGELLLTSQSSLLTSSSSDECPSSFCNKGACSRGSQSALSSKNLVSLCHQSCKLPKTRMKIPGIKVKRCTYWP
eukprot:Lithocolla_globosa_v1_NODE_1021_length_2950_cov_4.172712.p4 type:complete len:107 gc:universal NODE_1021_length_2950_cov_4.172712:1009-689(-)